MREQAQAFAADGRLLGIGIGLYVEPSTGMMDPMGTETAVVRVQPTGKVTVALGTGAHGQGIETTMAQVVAEALGLELDDIAILQGDTAVTAYGRGTGGSGTAVIAGNACRVACAEVRDKALTIAAHLMEAAPEDLELIDGVISVRGTPTRSVAFADVARVAYLETSRLPEGIGVGLEATATYKAPPFSWSNACHICTVEIDRDTGVVKILRYVVSEDCGVMINPMIVEGQIAGGVVQGIGGALYEELIYDGDGNPLTTTFMDYLLPTAAEAPDIEYGHIETPSATPGGHKGMGEGGAIGSPPAVFNAVADALALVGARIDRRHPLLTPDAHPRGAAHEAGIRNPYLVERLRPFGTTIFAEMSALAVATGSINLGQGFPDTDGPDVVRQAAIDAINEGRGNQYPPGIGVPELRHAISAHQQHWYDLAFDPDTEVLVTAGATEAIAAALLALCEPGDEVVTFEPYYDSYAACIAMAGATRKVVTLRPPDYAFAIDELRAAITPRTKLLLLNSPHNPTGKVFSLEELQLIAELAQEHDLLVVTDEVYEHLVFEGSHVPIATLPGMRERTITISSGGKTFSFTGWKVGWVCATPELTTAVKTAKQFLTYVNAGPFQYAIAAGLDLPDAYFHELAADLRDETRPVVLGTDRCRLRSVPAARHIFRHRRHPCSGGSRRARVLPLASGTLRRRRSSQRRVLRRRRRRTLTRAVCVLQAHRSARRGVHPAEGTQAVIVAGVQHDIVWEDPEANFAHLAPLIARAAADGARLVVCTEMFSTGFSMQTDRIAEPVDGPSVQFLVAQARANAAWVCASLPERVDGADRPFNQLVLAAPDGAVHRYAKIHPFSYGREDAHYASGDRFLTVDVDGVRCSFFVCYDLRFADEFWAVARDTDCYVIPANWPDRAA